MRDIVQCEWREIHPVQMAFKTDKYYTELANRVLKVLRDETVHEVFYYDDEIKDAAIRLTAWFEDICSDLGFWRVVNQTCQKRYGKPIPFYNTENYTIGELNFADVQLMLWDVIKSLNFDSFINPENPAIGKAAYEIYSIFYDEYETAPATDELKDYLSNDSLGTKYWDTRKAVEWISIDGYFSLNSNMWLEEELDDIEFDDKEQNGVFKYAIKMNHVFKDRHNLLSLTAAEWLSEVIGRPFSFNAELMELRPYNIESRYASALQLRDLANNECHIVEEDSFDEKWYDTYGRKIGLSFCTSLVEFNGKYYQCGSLITNPPIDFSSDLIRTIHQREKQSETRKANYEQFCKLSDGAPILFLKGKKQLFKFYTDMCKVSLSADTKRMIEEDILGNTENDMVAIMATPETGTLNITGYIPAIKAPNNPYYDEKYAKENGSSLLLDTNAIDYESICILLKRNYLPDAALRHFGGYERGRQLLQNNAQFIVDYMFSNHR